MGDRFVSQESVLCILYEIKDNDQVPKNHETILDIIRRVRNLPAATINQDFANWIENKKEEAEQTWSDYDDEQALGEDKAYESIMQYLRSHNIVEV